jgi:hypothetical protein
VSRGFLGRSMRCCFRLLSFFFLFRSNFGWCRSVGLVFRRISPISFKALDYRYIIQQQTSVQSIVQCCVLVFLNLYAFIPPYCTVVQKDFSNTHKTKVICEH